MEKQNEAVLPQGRQAPAVSPEDAVFIALELGENILKCGGEISRAEETVSRICYAYGAATVDVVAILMTIIVTAEFEGQSITSTRRITDYGTNNLGRLAAFNDLSRKICEQTPTRAECEKRIDKILIDSSVSLTRYVIGSALTSLGFAVFFGDFSAGVTWQLVGGLFLDGALSGIIALLLGLIARGLARTKTTSIVSKFIICFIGGILASIVGHFIPICHADKIMIGNIMNVIPGVAMTNAFRDMLGGDIMSGVFRLCSAIIDAVAIAAGYAVAILLVGGILV
ncbi:MAG: threonine/serine exporter family protein [Clostridia bacterium]|nr:threonine/serine exporter family protein [Clostridia bacterium]